MTAKPLVVLDRVTKRFGEIKAVDGISVKIPPASIIGFIGPDGSGKSTTMKIMLTLEKMDTGSGAILGTPLNSARNIVRKNVGYMPETFSLYQDLTVEENLRFFFQIYRLPREKLNDKLTSLYRFNRLDKFRKTLAGRLSGGMKQKLALSCALMNDPVLLVLDEPTTGVDPVSRIEFWKMLSELRAQGKGIVLSTPYLDEAINCDYIYLFYTGKILLEGNPRSIIQNYPIDFYEIHTVRPIEKVKEFKSRIQNAKFYLIGDRIHFSIREKNEAIFQQITKIESNARITQISPSLEDIFLDILEKDTKTPKTASYNEQCQKKL